MYVSSKFIGHSNPEAEISTEKLVVYIKVSSDLLPSMLLQL